jgi:hypothetical protein
MAQMCWLQLQVLLLLLTASRSLHSLTRHLSCVCLLVLPRATQLLLLLLVHRCKVQC